MPQDKSILNSLNNCSSKQRGRYMLSQYSKFTKHFDQVCSKCCVS